MLFDFWKKPFVRMFGLVMNFSDSLYLGVSSLN